MKKQGKHIMKKGTHGKLEQSFVELNPQGQAKSITGQVNRLTASINRHLEDATSPKERQRRKEKCINQIERALKKIRNIIMS